MNNIKKFIKAVYVSEKMKTWLHMRKLGLVSDCNKTLTLWEWKKARQIYLAASRRIEDYREYRGSATGIKI